MARDLASPTAFSSQQRRALQDLSRRIEELPQGIVMPFPGLAVPQVIPASTPTAVTGEVKFTFKQGRRYRIYCLVRAFLQKGTGNDCYLALYDGASGLSGVGGNWHFQVPAGTSFDQAQGECWIDGDGRTYNDLHWRLNATVATDAYVDFNFDNIPARIEDWGAL